MLGNLRITGYAQNLNASLLIRYVGKQYLDNTENEDRTIEAYNLADLTLAYSLKDFLYFPELRLIFNIKNLFDVKYETAGHYYYENYYYPGAERNYYLGLTFNL